MYELVDCNGSVYHNIHCIAFLLSDKLSCDYFYQNMHQTPVLPCRIFLMNQDMMMTTLAVLVRDTLTMHLTNYLSVGTIDETLHHSVH